ncbi:hemerythrin domain-containing protein [Bdellovibrionota bacterium FG-2]
MKATDILSSEHLVILQVLSCLQTIAEAGEKGGRIAGGSALDAKNAIAFIQGFADSWHHGKEEDVLFKMMEERGFSADAGPTYVMRMEHDQGRALVRAMKESLGLAAEGNSTAVKTFVESAQGFAALLSSHIEKEDSILYKMANQALSDEDQQTTLDRFAVVESQKITEMGEGVPERYLAIAQKLGAQYGVKLEGVEDEGETEACGGGCCCGH